MAAEPEKQSQRIKRALHELDLDENERAELLPTALWLARTEPPASSAETIQQVVARLAPYALQWSSVRQAIQAHKDRQSTVGTVLQLARAQMSMLHPLFWLLSVGIVALGTAALSSGVPLNRALFLQALGPMLAYLGALLAFRGMGLRVLECEMACPPSLIQMTLARLLIVLGYDLALGIGMTGVLSAHERLSLAPVLLHWLMPLLLVMGVALALSEWLTIALSATLAYGAWLSLVAIQLATQQQAHLLWSISTTSTFEVVLGIAGMTLLVLTLGRMRILATHWLPHV